MLELTNSVDLFGITICVIVLIVCFAIYKYYSRGDDIFNFSKDYKSAQKEKFQAQKNLEGEHTYIGNSTNKKEVFIPNNAKHVFVCGTTGSGKTVALANFIKSGIDYDYPMLIIDGKGDIGADSLFDITQRLGTDRKIYIIDLNNPNKCHKYNPFQNTSADIIKDMLINMTNWSEEHYKYNTERYIQRLCYILEKSNITVSFESLIKYLPTQGFLDLSKNLVIKNLLTKEQHAENINLAKISGQIAENASARFATIKESSLGQIFDEKGIDIYTALKENAIILFVLNPLLYPEMSPLIGNLIIIDSKKAISNFYQNKKDRVFYILDEINVYASPSLLDLVNKSRSANTTCILATQSLSDLDTISEQFKEQIIENCNNYVVLRQNSSTNAEHWATVFGTRQSMQATYQVGSKNGSNQQTGLGSLRPTREFIYHPDDIKRLETGNAIFLSRDNKSLHTKIKVNKPF